MGMDVKGDVWVGFDLRELEKEGISLVSLESFPEELYDNGVIEVDGLKIEFFSTSGGEERVGLGVELIHHDWDYGVKRVDLAALSKKAEELKPQLKKIFAEWGIHADLDIYLALDYC